ncbi:MAG: hypothetical protein FWB72_00165 [Firmicutes bacterium]|nr:hypothetical protein [Bacillota bacterium]
MIIYNSPSNAIFIYNPVAGRGRIKKRLGLIIIRLNKRFGKVDVKETSKKGDALEFAKEACGRYEYIIFGGGDGTFNEIVNGIACYKPSPILGYIPSGTTCDIASNFKLPRNILRALEIIENGIASKKALEIDALKINEVYAVYAVGAGSLVSIGYKTCQNKKNRIGRLAYFLGALNINKHIKGLDIESIELKDNTNMASASKGASLLLVLNSKHVAGAKINRGYKHDSGSAQLILVKKTSNNKIRKFLSVASALMFLRFAKIEGDFYTKNLSRTTTSNLKIKTQNANWSIDGEKSKTLNKSNNIEIKVLPKHIRLIVGENTA